MNKKVFVLKFVVMSMLVFPGFSAYALNVVTPNGGEEFVSGNEYTIEWDGSGVTDPNVFIEYSIDTGQSWNDVTTIANSDSYEWLVPEATSPNCLVRISDANDANVYDTSDDVFTILVCQRQLSGDLNGNCYVDLEDFALFAADYLTCGNPLDNDCGLYEWFTYNGHRYALTKNPSTWADAEAEAVAVGGHLVTINDFDEDEWLFATFHSSSEQVWIGLYQDHDHPDYSEPAGGWVWISGQPVTYTGWGGDEPNNGYGSGGDYACFHTAGWYWNDLPPDYPSVRGIIEVPW